MCDSQDVQLDKLCLDAGNVDCDDTEIGRSRSSSAFCTTNEFTKNLAHAQRSLDLPGDADVNGELEKMYDGAPEVGRNVPGANASSLRIHSLWHCLGRHILDSNTGFAVFYRQMLKKPLGYHDGGPTTAQLPMPLPYVLSRVEQLDGEELAFRKAINLQVGFLNYLHLGMPTSPPKHICRPGEASAGQWLIVQRLRKLSLVWNETPLVAADDMGRVAAKQERQEGVLEELSKLASSSSKSLKKYGFGSQRIFRARPSKEAGLVVGELRKGDVSGAQSIVASRLKMEGDPVFVPDPHLDEATRFLYNNPFHMVPDNLREVEPPPRVQVHASDDERIALLELLENSDRLGFRGRQEVIEGFGNGMFCVPKNTKNDRLILDGRPANLLQRPPGKYILSMASATTLCGLHLDPHQQLIMSGDDLSNFFYTFKVNSQRVARNFLDWKIPTYIARRFKSFPSYLDNETYVYACLSTLAMGDSAACDYAQTSHLSMGLQCGSFKQQNLVSLYGRIPRTDFMAGIIIDDFIAMEKVALGATTGLHCVKSRQTMHDMYKQVGLDAHPSKGFADETVAEFWGASVDGVGGLIRANVSRCISLVWVTAQVARMGICSVGLLEVLAGGYVSIFGFRRRMMSLLDLVYVMQAGRERREVVRLSPAAVDELWSLVVLCPLAVTSLRSVFSDKVYMVDASNWGDAVISAGIDGGMRSEIHRHAATKSSWTRLLSPFKAMQRGKGCLSVFEELPSGLQEYSEHPVWEIAARAFDYSVVWKQQAKMGRHINKGELRAYLKAEELGAQPGGDVRVPIGSDSQVCIGAVCKGRSASVCLNGLLKKSLGNVLSLGIYSAAGYIGSARNPADDPTRGVALRVSDVDVPDWWEAAVAGNYNLLDSFLSGLELHPYQLAGYGDLSEISGNVFTEIDPGLKKGLNRYCKKVRNRIQLRAKKLKDDCVKQVTCTKTKSFFSEEVLACLESFGKEQFIFKDGLEWPPQTQGFLDLYSGKKGFAHASVRYGASWVLTVDFLDGPQCDLLDSGVRKRVEFLLQSGVFIHLSAAPICSSLSRAITPPVRTRAEPWGIKNVSPSMKIKITDGNSHSKWLASLVVIAIKLGLKYWVENPDSSFLWVLPEWESLPGNASKMFYKCDYCTYKTPWRKRTRFLTNGRLAGQRRLCSRDHKHILLRGRGRGEKACWTKLAEPYPRILCAVLAHAACSDLGLFSGPVSLACRSNHRRVGEAKNPGPKAKLRRPKDPQQLDDVELIRPETVAIGKGQWDKFVCWVESNAGHSLMSSLWTVPSLMGAMMGAYGRHWYGLGGAMHSYRHLIVFTQRTWPSTRGHLQEAWSVLSRWEELEPVEHRRPVPRAMVEAMCVLALKWGWTRVVCIILITYHGCARPGEVLKAPRSFLVLPEDLGAPAGSPCFLKVSKPKPGRRGMGRVQHCKIRDHFVSCFLSSNLVHVSGSELLYPGSPSAFRYRWNFLLRSLLVPSGISLTPGCLRAGGTVELYRQGMPIMDILWSLRLKNLETLQHYLQEISTQITMIDLPWESRSLILNLAKLFNHFISMDHL